MPAICGPKKPKHVNEREKHRNTQLKNNRRRNEPSRQGTKKYFFYIIKMFNLLYNKLTVFPKKLKQVISTPKLPLEIQMK